MFKSLLLAAAFAGGASVHAQTPAPQARCRLVWDNQFLYATFQIDDEDVRAQVRDVSPRSYPAILQDDGVGLSVQVGDGNPATLLVSAAGGFAFLKDAVPSPLFSVKFGAEAQGTLNRSGDRDRGFTVELALPWQALGVDGAKVDAQTAVRGCLSVRLRGVSTPFSFPAQTSPDDPKSWKPLSLNGGAGLAADRAKASPTVDGIARPDEWPGSPVAFEISPAAAPTPTSAAALPLPVFGAPGDAVAPALRLDAPVAPERRVFARFLPTLNADLVKPTAPQRGILAADGSISLPDQPAQGLGPWYSSDRVAWHRYELGGMARAGIDVALTVVGSPSSPFAPQDAKALTVLAAARKELDRERLPSPNFALSLDTSAFAVRPDLASAAGQDALFAAIARWFEIIPADQRAVVRIPADTPTGAALAYPVFLSDAAGFIRPEDAAWSEAIRKRFAETFGPASGGITLTFIGGPGFSPRLPGFAAVLPGPGPGEGAVRTFLLQPGSQTPFVARRFGETYRKAWDDARAAAADWLLVDSWNDFARATEIAPSRQYGDGYVGLTRLALTAGISKGAPQYAVRFGDVDAPRRLRPSQLVSVAVSFRNAGERPLLVTDNLTLSYRWLQAGKVVVEGPFRIGLKDPVAPGQSAVLKIGVGTVVAPNQPLAEGAYQLQLVVTHPGGADTLSVPVDVDSGEAVTIAGSTLSPLLRAGAAYPARVRLRHHGAEPLVPGSAQLVWQVLAPESDTPLARGSEPLDRPIAPGDWVTVPATVDLAELEPAFPERQAEPGTGPAKWAYRIVWSVVRAGATAPLPGGREERFALYPGEDEARITVPTPPGGGTLAADRSVTVPVLIANTGSVRWPKGRIALTGRWFQADGFPVPVLTAVPNTTLDREVAPGEAVMVNLMVRTPDRAGRFVLGVFALRPPDGFLSLHPISRTSDTAFVPLHVTGGKLTHVDLGGAFDTDAVATEGKPGDGAFDTTGATLPAEWFPADRFGLNAAETVYPSGYFTDLSSDIVRGTTFRFGPAEDGKKNAVSCHGQTLAPPRGKYVTLHLAAAATGGKARDLTVTLRYRDGKTETITRPVRDWTEPLRSDEALSIRFPRRRTPSGDRPETAALQHVIVPVRTVAELVGIQLPNDPQLKLFAATLEQ